MSRYLTPINLLKAIIGVLLLLISATLVVNTSLFDESLSDEAKAALAPRDMPPAEENIYFALMGINAAENVDFIAAGIALDQRYQQNRDRLNQDKLSQADYEDILGGSDKAGGWQDAFKNCNSRREQNCLKTIANDLAGFDTENPRYLLLTERYQRILTLPAYKEIDHLSFATPLPPFGTLLDLGKVQAGIYYQRGDRQALIAHLSQESRFWKRLLRDGDMLLTRMIAVAGLWTNIQFLSEISQDSALSNAERQLAQPILSSLSPTELDISDSFEFEFRGMVYALDNLAKEPMDYGNDGLSAPLNWLIQPNATKNAYYESLSWLNCISQLSAKSLQQALKSTASQKNCDEAKQDLSLSYSPSSLYNLGGKLLLGIVYISPQDYVARMHDLNGMISLLNLQIAIAENGQRASDVVVRSKIRDPYLDKPMTIDSRTRTLSFDCLSPSSVCQLSY